MKADIVYVFGIAAVLILVLLARLVWRRTVDPIFATFFAFSLLYLEIAPALVVAGGTNSAATIALDRNGYAFYELLIICAFQAPLWISYRLIEGRRRRETQDGQLVVKQSRAKILAYVAIVWSAAYLAELIATNGLFTRVGAGAASSRAASLGAVPTVILGTFRDSVLLLAAVLGVLIVAGDRRNRRLLIIALSCVSLAYVPTTALSSRLTPILYVVNLAGWMALARGHRLRVPGSARRIVMVLILCFVLLEVALNGRQIMPAIAQHNPVPSVKIYGLDTKGADGPSRLDCVDLTGLMGTQTLWHPDGLAPWSVMQWQVRRYFDRAGFDAYRLQLGTQVKDYFVEKYVDPTLPDFPSCDITDGFGSFSVFGLVATGLIFGLGYGAIRRRGLRLRTVAPQGTIIAIFFAGWWLSFERSLSAAVLGWLNAVPLIFMLCVFPPWMPADVVEPGLAEDSAGDG